jgi:hypothetical protein
MGTQPRASAPVRVALVAILIFTACGGSGGKPSANHSPAASASPGAGASATAVTTRAGGPSPRPVNGAYGVLVSSQASSPYTVALIGVDGRVAATAEASTPPITNCGSAAAAPYPLPVSTSNTRVYFMDAAGVIHFLGPAGDSGTVTSVPAPSSSRRATFAVSPDDRRIAVVVATYSSTGASTSLYVEDLNGGGNRVNLFSETGVRTLWAVGWRGTNNLVLGVVVSCTQGGGAFCCSVRELHVVDPATATRRFTLGSYSTCPIAGPASPSGVVCENSSSQATWQNWTAGTVRSLAINGPTAAFVSPKGGFVAMVDSTGTSFTIGAPSISQMFACTWIDDTHVMSGGDPQHQPRVVEVVSSTVVPVAAQGDCGGRIPGGL